MSEFNYKEYLASREWAERKEAVRERSRGLCERCGIAHYESTHHVTYKNIGNEPLEDLLAVCDPCHAFLSAKSADDPASHVRLFVLALDIRMLRDDQKFAAFNRGMAEMGKVRFIGTVGPEHVEVSKATFHGPLPVWLKSAEEPE